ncbi:MAG: ABC transporter transmembrane domain-containing protein [Thalassobaculaceae bacterium]|nr:ABC transporter transmembrane domain-containing protein [Thalassobaculaceae bacterium]
MSASDNSFAKDIEKIPNAATPSIVLASLISNLMATGLPIAILIIYDRVLPNASEYTLSLLTAGVLGAVAIDVMIRIARGAIVGHRAARYGHRAFLGVMEKVFAADPRSFQTESTALHLERLGAIDAIRESRAGYLPQLIVDFPFFILFVALVFLIGGPLGFVLLSFVVITAIAAVISGLTVRSRMEARQANNSAQANFMMEVLTGIATIKSYAMEPLMKRRYERVMESSATITAKLIQGSISAQALTNLVTQAAQISIVAAGSLAVVNGSMTIGGIAACMLLTGRALQPLNRASMLWSQYQSVRIAKQRIRELAAMPTIASGGGIVRESLHGTIEFRDVTFTYTNGRAVFENLTLAVDSAETVLVSSRGNWGGKSTLLALAGHILLPDSGTVLYDNIEAEAFDDEWLRSRIAYLGQNPSLFEGTIFDNITGFDSSPEHIEVAEDIAEELGLTEAVSKLPLGFQTEVRATGSETLPASIRQQIPIVRALARLPDIVLIDECNSNLDRDADDRFRAALARRQTSTTIMMVTPRPSFQALAHREITIGGDVVGAAASDEAPTVDVQAQARILTASGGGL